LQTRYEQIVNPADIGKPVRTSLNELAGLARREHLSPSSEDKEKILLLAIDVQNDFMEGGPLGVPGSLGDVGNLTRFIYENMGKITKIMVSLDTHQPMQIFHPAWWKDPEGNPPQPFTLIRSRDVEEGKWIPQLLPEESLEYVTRLEKLGKKELCIWPYHCIEGTFGCALEGQFANMVYFHSLVRQTEVKRLVKGLHPDTEMYGIFRPEYSRENLRNEKLLEEISTYDRILVAGEAKSHCVLESVSQLLEYFREKGIPGRKLTILEDCMSPIGGYEDVTEEAFRRFVEKDGIQVVRSSEILI
jgi:hypothetical protein